MRSRIAPALEVGSSAQSGPRSGAVAWSWVLLGRYRALVAWRRTAARLAVVDLNPASWSVLLPNRSWSLGDAHGATITVQSAGSAASNVR